MELVWKVKTDNIGSKLKIFSLLLGWCDLVQHFISFLYFLAQYAALDILGKKLKHENSSKSLYLTCTLENAVGIIVSTFLIVGIYRRNAEFVKVYLYGIVLTLIISEITQGMHLLSDFQEGQNPKEAINEMVFDSVLNIGKNFFDLNFFQEAFE